MTKSGGRTRCVAMMAGGRGLRLWPRSTAGAPKQFHGFFGMPALLAQACTHAALLAAESETYVITAADLLPAAEQLVPRGARLVAEPCGRDTAACVGLAALLAEHDHPGAVLTLLPADHWIGDSAAFAQTLTRAADLAAAGDGGLVTVGMRPTRPETGYGYLLVEPADGGLYRGRRFREKPGAAEAARLIAEGNAFWNAGIFVARAATFLDLIRQHLPALATGLDRVAGVIGTPSEAQVMAEVYAGLDPVSFDHGVAEHLSAFTVVAGEFPWDDLGSWAAFGRQLPRDTAGNLTAGQVFAAGATDCLVDTPDFRTLLLGVSGLIVVQEGDALLITTPDHAADLKRAVTDLGLG